MSRSAGVVSRVDPTGAEAGASGEPPVGAVVAASARSARAPAPTRATPARRPAPVRRTVEAPSLPSVVPAPMRARARASDRVAFGVLFCSVVGVMLLGLVSLNAVLAKQSFAVDDLSKRIHSLEVRHLELVSEQAQLSAPRRIARWARHNGMRVPADDDLRLLRSPRPSPARPPARLSSPRVAARSSGATVGPGDGP